MRKKVLFGSAFFLLVLSLVSCGTTESLSCPYVLANPHVELGSCEEKHNFAGLYFSLFNGSEKNIDEFTVSYMLYDSDGNNPFVGSNSFVSKCKWDLRAGGMVDFVIDLDSYLSVVPDEPYLVDFMYVREISYSDGSSWKDPYGMYCVREVCE